MLHSVGFTQYIIGPCYVLVLRSRDDRMDTWQLRDVRTRNLIYMMTVPAGDMVVFRDVRVMAPGQLIPLPTWQR